MGRAGKKEKVKDYGKKSHRPSDLNKLTSVYRTSVLLLMMNFVIALSKKSADAPGYCLAERRKFELTNQESTGGKNFTVRLQCKLSGKALKSGDFSHCRWH